MNFFKKKKIETIPVDSKVDGVSPRMQVSHRILDALKQEDDYRRVILLSPNDYIQYGGQWFQCLGLKQPMLVLKDSNVSEPTTRPITDEEWLQYHATERELLYLILSELQKREINEQNERTN